MRAAERRAWVPGVGFGARRGCAEERARARESRAGKRAPDSRLRAPCVRAHDFRPLGPAHRDSGPPFSRASSLSCSPLVGFVCSRRLSSSSAAALTHRSMSGTVLLASLKTLQSSIMPCIRSCTRLVSSTIRRIGFMSPDQALRSPARPALADSSTTSCACCSLHSGRCQAQALREHCSSRYALESSR
ncbi:hypothetical protein BD413DRAFT_217178 [Trametes elegans]|nr:hypothetical protein BD413DRAFT_217178 [Trametes elegans]